MIPNKFRSDFSFHYIEDENGKTPNCFEGIETIIPLECVVTNGTMKLFGKQSIYKTRCYNLKFNNHNYGMYFEIVCQNKDYLGKVLWRRSLTREYLSNILSNSNLNFITLEGDSPDVANANPFGVKIEIIRERSDIYAVNITAELDLETYNMFISRYLD